MTLLSRADSEPTCEILVTTYRSFIFSWCTCFIYLAISNFLLLFPINAIPLFYNLHNTPKLYHFRLSRTYRHHLNRNMFWLTLWDWLRNWSKCKLSLSSKSCLIPVIHPTICHGIFKGFHASTPLPTSNSYLIKRIWKLNCHFQWTNTMETNWNKPLKQLKKLLQTFSSMVNQRSMTVIKTMKRLAFLCFVWDELTRFPGSSR